MKEYSTVLFGAESDTPVHGIKTAEDAIVLIQKLENRLKFGFITDPRGKQIEKHIEEIKNLSSTQSLGGRPPGFQNLLTQFPHQFSPSNP